MKIKNIEPDSIAEQLGLQVGDKVLSINGNAVRDILDYRFFVADQTVEMEVLTSAGRVIFDIEKEYEDALGLDLEDLEIRFCGNDCPFCFVDQNPAGMRDTLYFRDEDFRLSFLSGHYVTLTNLSKRDMNRIVEQQLSPLFVSVHATEPEVRKFLFGIKHDDKLIEKLAFLTGHGIEIHTQVVLCPEVNDDLVLRKTIDDLAGFLPQLRSVSVVPVGLTKHRKGLKELKAVTSDYAEQYLDIIEAYAKEFQLKHQERFVYAGDEFYLIAKRDFPKAECYDGYYQVENGVGMFRYMLDLFDEQKSEFPAKLSVARKATLVTAELAAPLLRKKILPPLAAVENFEVELAVVENNFYGKSIHVTGLLTGQDIYARLCQMALGDVVFLPGNCLKDNEIFLDDWTIFQLSEKLSCPVVALQNDFSEIFPNLNL